MNEADFQRRHEAEQPQRDARNQLYWEQQSRPTSLQLVTTGYDIDSASDKPEYQTAYYAANREHILAYRRDWRVKKAATEAAAKSERAKKLIQQLQQSKQSKEQNQPSTKPAPKQDYTGKKKMCSGTSGKECGMQTKDKFTSGQWNGRADKRRQCKTCQSREHTNLLK